MKNFKPMLAGTVGDITTLPYPMLASPKLDGIRAVVIDGVIVSRNLKPIPNKRVQKMFGKVKYNGLDGELVVTGKPGTETFRATTHAVMSEDADVPVTFVVFDLLNYSGTYQQRFKKLLQMTFDDNNVEPVRTYMVRNPDEVTEMEERVLQEGYEGLMLRHPDSPYKFGRSTVRESYLLKLKRFEDSEAEIIAFEEQLHNGNTATKDALGNTKRTSHKANKSGKGTLGALKVRDLKSGVEFSIGSGFDDELRAAIWANWTSYSKQIVKYKYFPTGSKDKPRFPVFLGFRNPQDL